MFRVEEFDAKSHYIKGLYFRFAFSVGIRLIPDVLELFYFLHAVRSKDVVYEKSGF